MRQPPSTRVVPRRLSRLNRSRSIKYASRPVAGSVSCCAGPRWRRVVGEESEIGAKMAQVRKWQPMHREQNTRVHIAERKTTGEGGEPERMCVQCMYVCLCVCVRVLCGEMHSPGKALIVGFRQRVDQRTGSKAR